MSAKKKKGFPTKLVAGATFLVLGGAVAMFISGPHERVSYTPPKKAPEQTIKISPPPPPPKPTPPPPQIKEPPKAIEQQPVEDVPKPEDKPPEPAPASLGTGIKGDGGTAGLVSGNGGGGSGTFGGTNRRGGGGGQWGWYASQVQAKITDSLRANPKTRTASMRIEVRVWSDSTGRISRAKLATSTGDAALDEAIRSDVLTGLQLPEPPPRRHAHAHFAEAHRPASQLTTPFLCLTNLCFCAGAWRCF